MDHITRLPVELGESLRALGAQVSTAESCTGGGIAEGITPIPGSSAWFEGRYLTYSDCQKNVPLGVPSELFQRFRAGSP